MQGSPSTGQIWRFASKARTDGPSAAGVECRLVVGEMRIPSRAGGGPTDLAREFNTLLKDPRDSVTRAVVEHAIATGMCTLSQRRAFEIIAKEIRPLDVLEADPKSAGWRSESPLITICPSLGCMERT
jgi:hypothetical protein